MNNHSPFLKLIPKVTKLAYTKISEIALTNNGIIYGGYVRDHIISEHYTSLYNRDHDMNTNSDDIGEFWNKDYHSQTSSRLISPTDMDICFSDVDAKNFMGTLMYMKEFQNVIHQDITYNSKYYSPYIERITKIALVMAIGAIPFVTKGEIVSIHLDIIVPKVDVVMQPPFRNLDMLCNGFLMTKNGITFSRDTGTVIDTYSTYDKNIAVSDIMKDMIEFKTHLCFQSTTNKWGLNLVAMKRIEKMEDKNLGWKFNNMPFKTEEYESVDSAVDECCICGDELKCGSYIAKSMMKKGEENIVSSMMHYKCCMKYLKHQSNEGEKQYLEEKFMFKCPMRNAIDFSTCILDIKRDFDPYRKRN